MQADLPRAQNVLRKRRVQLAISWETVWSGQDLLPWHARVTLLCCW